MTRFLIQAIIGITAWGVLGFAAYEAMPSAATYDCSLASFHPDYLAKVRKQCREVKR